MLTNKEMETEFQFLCKERQGLIRRAVSLVSSNHCQNVVTVEKDELKSKYIRFFKSPVNITKISTKCYWNGKCQNVFLSHAML